MTRDPGSYPPAIILITGIPGAGKTTVARALATFSRTAGASQRTAPSSASILTKSSAKSATQTR
jgi:broad-specificity NMP kinase